MCLNPYAVLHLRQLDRVVKSAFVHRDLFHLLANMTGVLEDGSYLESRDGSAANFLTRVACLLAASQGTLVALSWSERKLAGYGGPSGAASWINDAVSGLTGGGARVRRRYGGGGGVDMLPFYNSGVVGFSGVNYAMKVVACHRRPSNTLVYLMGILPVPVRYAFWFELAMGTMIVPSSGTFAAHFAGAIAGLLTVYVPKMVGLGPLGAGGRSGGWGGRNRAYSGRGQRLGGRYLRDDEPADTRYVRAMTARAAGGRGGGGSQGGGSFGGAGRRLGDGSGDDDEGRRGRRGGGGQGAAAKRLWRLLAAPFVMIKGAVDEGAPLVVHGGFAMACILLQQVMSRQMPEGVLSRITVPRTFERGVSFR